MKIFTRILLGILVISTLGLAIGTIYAINTKLDFDDEVTFVEDTIEINEGINSIQINQEEVNIEIEIWDKDYTELDYRLIKNDDNEYVKVENSTLLIGDDYNFEFDSILDFQTIFEWIKKGQTILENESQSIKIYLPKNNLENIELNIVSGSINISGIETNKLNIDNVDGNTTLSNIVANNLNYNGVDGDIEITSSKIDNFKFDNVDGDTDIVDSEFNKMYFDCVNGNISMKGSQVSEFEVDTVNSDITFDYVKAKDIRIDLVTGTIDLLIVGTRDDYSIEANDQKIGDGSNEIIIDAVDLSYFIDFVEEETEA